jgi:hypothetical protein
VTHAGEILRQRIHHLQRRHLSTGMLTVTINSTGDMLEATDIGELQFTGTVTIT